MKGIRSSQAIVALFVMILATTALASTPYDVGFTWNRWADWKDGTTTGSSAGNPSTDSAGNPVWSYEYYKDVPDGSDSSSTHPWYKLPSSGLMVWDGTQYPVCWAYQYQAPPRIFPGPYGLRHLPQTATYAGNVFPLVPLVRWDNPSTIPIRVSLTPGSGFQGVIYTLPTGTTADIVIALTDASDGGSVHVLYSQTITKTLSLSEYQWFDLPALNIEDLVLDPGDDILFSVRARAGVNSSPLYSVGFNDNVSITVVPEPVTLSVLALGSLAMMRRRRARR